MVNRIAEPSPPRSPLVKTVIPLFSILVPSILLIGGFFLLARPVKAQGGSLATVPFSDGFESGVLEPVWSTSTTSQGRVQVSTYNPFTGTYSVLLDDAVNDSVFSISALILNLDLTGETGLSLDFWWRGFGDENHLEDGVFISDDAGANWYPVYSFNNGPFIYQYTSIDLDTAAFDNGLTYNNQFRIKFQFYDDDPVPSDGYAIDEVSIRRPEINVTPQTLNSQVYIGYSSQQEMVVTNLGGGRLDVQSIQVDSPLFTVFPTDLYLAGGESEPLTVTIAPTQTGIFTTALILLSNAANAPTMTVPVTVTVVSPPVISLSPTLVEETLNAGTTQHVSLTISNTGSSDLNYNIGGFVGHSGAGVNVGTITNKASSPASLTSVTADPNTGYIYAQADSGNNFYRYDPDQDTWSQLSSSPLHSGNNGGAAYLDGKIYTVYTSNSSQMGVYDVASDSWSTMTNGLGAGTGNIATDGRYLYLVVYNTFRRYDPVLDTWATLTSPTIYFEPWGALAYLDGTFYGHTGNGYTDFASYDVATDSWTTLPSLPDGAVLGGAIDPVAQVYYAYGNYGGSSLFAYHIITDTWTQPANLPFTLYDGGMARIGRQDVSGIYIVQGEDGPGLVRLETLPDGVDWLMAQPVTGTVAAGSAVPVTLTLDATDLISGTYLADLSINSNDPATPEVTLPVTMHVIGEAAVVISPTVLDLGTVFVGETSSGQFLVENSGTADLRFAVTDVSNPALSAFTTGDPIPPLAPGQMMTVTYSPTAPESLTASVTITTNAPATPVITMSVVATAVDPPILDLSPSALSAVLYADEIDTVDLAVSNIGGSDLEFTILSETELEDVLEEMNQNYYAVTDLIPNLYYFTEGIIGSSIIDGGNDMYDGGNYLNTDYATAIPYSDDTVLDDGSFGPNGRYVTRKYPGLFFLAADLDGVSYFELTGYLGADGSGNVDGTVLQTTVNGVTYYGFVKRVYNAFDPSVNHLIIVADSGANHQFSFNTDDDQHIVYDLDNATRLYYLLYAGAGGEYIDDSTTLSIMETFLQTVDATLGGDWVTVWPVSGTVASGSSFPVAVTFDAAGLISDTYTAELAVVSNDPATPRASVPVTLHVTGEPAGDVWPSLLDMGTLYVGETTSQPLFVENYGTANLVVYDITADDPAVSVSASSFSVPPLGGSQWVTVTYSPTTAQNLTATLTITTNDPFMPVFTVQVEGTAVYPPEISVSPPSIERTVPPDTLWTEVLTISNTGSSPLFWDLLTSGQGLEDDFDPTLDSPEWASTTGASVTPGGCGSVSGNALYFSGSGVRSATTIPLNMATGGTVTFYLRIGTGGSPCENADASENIVLEYSTNGGATWTILRTYLENQFGSFIQVQEIIPTAAQTPNTQFRWRQLLHSGTSFDHWAIDNVVIFGSGMIDAVTPLSGTIPAASSTPVSLTLNSTGLLNNTYYATILINSNDPVTPQVTVPITVHVEEGDPVAVITPDTLDFGTVYTGQTYNQTFHVDNTGLGHLDVSDITADDPTLSAVPSQFTVPVLSSGQDVTVSYSPTVAGDLTATLTITTNDPVTPVFTVTVLAAAVDPPVIFVSPAAISQTVESTTQQSVTLTISNTGSSDLNWSVSGSGSGAEVGIVGSVSAAMTSLLNGDGTLAGQYHFTNLGNSWSYATLDPYDVILVAETDNGITAAEASALLSFYNSGRSIIMGMDDVDNLPTAVRNDLYTIFGVTNAADAAFQFGTLNSAHPVAQGVTTIGNVSDGDNDYFTPNGATWVARGNDGRNYVLAYDGLARTVIMGELLNTWYSAAPQLVRNALLWTNVPWLATTPDAGTIPPQASAQVVVTLDATDFLSGTYTAALHFFSNDPVTPQVTVPVTMVVSEHNAGPTEPSLSTVEVSPEMVFANGLDTAFILVTLRDAADTPVTNRLVELQVSGSDNIITPAPQIRTDVHGQATFFLASSAVETKTLTVRDVAYDISLPAEEVEFIWPPADPGQTSALIAPGTVVASAGANQASITLTVRDVFGRPLADRSIQLLVSGSGNFITPSNTGDTDINGQVTFFLASTQAGSKQISIRDINTNVTFQVGTMQITPAAVDATRSLMSVVGSSTAAANGVDFVRIRVTARDAFDNNVPGVSVILHSPGPVSFTQPPPTDQFGQAIGNASSTQRGPAIIEATVAGVQINAFVTVNFLGSDLAVTKSGPAEVGIGRFITYTLRVQNNGLLEAANTVLTDVLPNGVTYVSDTAPVPAVQTGNQLVWNLGNLAKGNSVQFIMVGQVTGTVITGQTLTNQAQASSDSFEENPGNNTAAVVTTVRGADIAVSKSAPPYAVIGQPILYNITVKNVGQLPAGGVTVTDTLPVSLTLLTHSAMITPVINGSQIGWNLGDFDPGESFTFAVIARVTDTITVGQTIQNVVFVTSMTADDNPANDTATTTSPVISPYAHTAGLNPANFNLGVGAPGRIGVQINNTGPLGDAYSVNVTGLDPTWYTAITETTPLNPGESKTVDLNFLVNTCTVTNTIPFTVTVSSQSSSNLVQTTGGLTLQLSPQQSGLVPAPGSKTGSRSVLFSWRTDAPTTGRLFLYPSGQPTQTAVYTTALNTVHNLTVHNLTRNTTYNWAVESTSDCGTSTTPAQSFTVGNGIVFANPNPSFNIHHDYNQQVVLTVRNEDLSRSHTLRVLLDNPYPDLIANFVGTGSIDDGNNYITLAPGESRQVTLAVHAQDAEQEFYDLTARVVANEGTADEILSYANVKVRVLRADQFSVTLIDTDPDTLVKTYRVTNEGLPITDLNIQALDPVTGLPGHVLIQPTISHARLDIDESLVFRVIPLFSPEDAVAVAAMERMNSQDGRVVARLQPDSGIQVELVVSAGGANQELLDQYACQPPEELYAVTLPNVRVSYANGDWYCTNRPNINFNIGTPGNINVADILGASLSASFSPHSGARAHSTQFYLNGNQIGGFSNQIPVGTYLFGVNPSAIRSSTNPVDVVNQSVSLTSQHPNGGHYVVSTNFNLDMVLSSYTQYVCATSPEEALEKARDNTEPTPTSVDLTITEPTAGSDVGVGQQLFLRASVDDHIPGQVFYPTAAAIYYQDHDEWQYLSLLPSTQVVGSQDVYEVVWTPQYTGTIVIQADVDAYTAQDSDSITVNGIELVNPPDLTVEIVSQPGMPNEGDIVTTEALITNLAEPIDGDVTIRFEYYYLELIDTNPEDDIIEAQWVAVGSPVDMVVHLQLATNENMLITHDFTVPFFANYLVQVTVDPE